jgi:hypothetical protein
MRSDPHIPSNANPLARFDDRTRPDNAPVRYLAVIGKNDACLYMHTIPDAGFPDGSKGANMAILANG